MKLRNNFTDNQDAAFREIVSMSEGALCRTMTFFLRKFYPDVVVEDDYIYAKGTLPVALVAHMDTVFDEPPESWSIFHDKESGVYWSPYGLGADDRAGVFGIITLINAGYRPTVILTLGEEVGGTGAKHFAYSIPIDPNIKFFIELDRQGRNDCVFYGCDNPNFTGFITNFGFKEEQGSFSDISFICPAWGIAGVNLSVGYYNEHSYTEIFFEFYLLRTICLVADILDTEVEEPFKYIPRKYDTVQNWLGDFSLDPLFPNDDDDEEYDTDDGLDFFKYDTAGL